MSHIGRVEEKRFSWRTVSALCWFMLVVPLNKAPAQTQPPAHQTKDLKDLFMSEEKRQQRNSSPGIIVGKNYISFLPVIGYAPANGFLIGAAVSISKLFDSLPTNLSSGMINAQYTSKNQFIANARSKIFLDHNKWSLQGDWRILIFTQPTYGLGINSTGGSDFLLSLNGLNNTTTDKSQLVQDMKFNYVRIYEDVQRRVSPKWFVGLGLAVDWHFKIVDEDLQLDSTQENFRITDHYAYSKVHDFNPEKYSTSGFNFGVLTDTRDNVANAYKGYLAAFVFRVNPEFLGSSRNSTMMSYDARYFHSLSPNTNPRHVLAFWSWGTFVTSGNVPYLALPSITWDTYNRSGRGYVQGRYRGTAMVYTEMEYRYPITKNGFLGGVVFVNSTFAQSPSQKLFDEAAPGVGAGLRIMMDKHTRTNLTVDLGYGRNNSSGIYFNLQEFF